MQRSLVESEDWVLLEERDYSLEKREKKNDLSEAIVETLATSQQQLTLFLRQITQIGDELSPETNPLMIRYLLNLLRVTEELFKPYPAFLTDEEKDQKAYETLLFELKTYKPLKDLVQHVHTRSSFMTVQKEGIGIAQRFQSPDDIELNLLTFNGAWLPELGMADHPLIQINKKILRNNTIRAREAIEFLSELIKLKSLDIFYFEEAFDKRIRRLLIEAFGAMGYASLGSEGEAYFNAGSGLLGFYKKDRLTLCDTVFQSYKGTGIGAKIVEHLGSETFAQKGIHGAKFIVTNQHGKKNVVSTLATHQMTAGFFSNDDTWEGSISDVRGRESQMVHFMAENWAKLPIKDDKGETIPHLGTAILGDFNKTLGLPYQMLSVSTGMSAPNHFEPLDVKYSGDHNLGLNLLSNTKKSCWPFPRNAKWAMNPKPGRTNGKKPINHERIQEAILENLATGTTFPATLLTSNKKGEQELTLQTTENRVIDLIAVSPDQSTIKAFESWIVLSINSSGKAISDHTMLWSVALFSPKVVHSDKSHLFFSAKKEMEMGKTVNMMGTGLR